MNSRNKFFSKFWICCLLAAVSAVFIFTGALFERAYAKDYVVARDKNTNVILAPTIVKRIVSAADFEATLSAKNLPDSVIVSTDGTNFTALNGEILGNADEIFNAIKSAEILPIIKIDSQEQASGLIAAGQEFYDYALTGENTAILSQVSECLPNARIYRDFSKEGIKENAYDYVKETRASGGTVAILSQRQATRKVVYYVQSMFTTVWVVSESDTEYDVTAAIVTGAHGIICDNHDTFFSVIDSFPDDSFLRGYYNIGHRGAPTVAAENSLEGFIVAYEAGATHFELDIQTTADDKLVVMHDGDIDRTTNGTGKIAEMTLDEIKQYKIVKTMGNKDVPPVNIPSFDEVLDYFKDKDVVIMVEIKDENPTTCTSFKESVERFEMQSKVVVVSFHEEQIELLHDIAPYLPIATLNSVNEENFGDYIDKAAKLNMCFDEYMYVAIPFNDFVNRGYMIWQWTFIMPQTAIKGICGVSNNYPCDFVDLIKYVYVENDLQLGKNDVKTAEFDVTGETFGGEKKTLKGKVFKYKETESGYDAIIMVMTTGEEGNFQGDYYYYTNVNIIKKGNNGLIIGACIFVAAALTTGIFVFVKFRKKRIK